MRAKSTLLVVAAFLIGALAAGSIGVRVIREVRTDEDANSFPTASTTSVPGADAYQVDPHETLIGSTALVPVSVDVDGNRLVIGYDLVPRGPRSGIDAVGASTESTVPQTVGVGFASVRPVRWEVETPEGVFDGSPVSTDTQIAVFDMYDGFALDDIVSVRIVEALTPFPIEVPFTMSGQRARVEIVPGVEVELVSLSSHGPATIARLGFEGDGSALDGLVVQGDGPGWWSDVPDGEDPRRIDLTFEGGALPDPIPLVAGATVWQEIDGPFTVDLGGLE